MDLPVLLLSGAIAGTMAGLLGIGGGVIIVPIVLWLFEGQGVEHGLAIKMALGTSLATIVVTAIASIYTHHRKGAVDWMLFSVMGPAAFIGSLLGAWAAATIPGNALYAAFTLFLSWCRYRWPSGVYRLTVNYPEILPWRHCRSGLASSRR